jgi:dolichol-phosphate mannosyltransferase
VKKRVLLTGGTGFVGANLAIRLLRDGHDVHLLVRPGHNPWRLEAIRGDLSWHQAELSDANAVSRVARDVKPDRVFHLAAYGAYSWETDPVRIFATNVVGVMNLIQACLDVGVESLVNAGSSLEYGFKDHAPSEDEALEPNSAYAAAKASAALFCRFASRRHGVPITSLRLYSVYGPFEDPNRLMPTVVLAGMNGTLPPFVDPAVARDFVYVDDVVEAFILAGEHRALGEILNVGTGRQTSINDVADLSRRVFAIQEDPKWGAMCNRRWDTDTWVADIRRIGSTLGWQPRTSVEQGFRRLVEWFAGDPAMARRYEMSGLSSR